MSEYPRWVHHKEHKDRLIQSAEEHKALGDGWGDDSSVWRSKSVEIVQEAPPAKEEPIEELPQSSQEKQGKKGKKDRKQST